MGELESWPLPQPGVKQKYDLSARRKKKAHLLSSPKDAGLEVEGASGYTFLFTTAQRKGQEKEGREARPASSRPLLFPRTQSGEAQGTAGAGEQHGSGKESRATERDPPLTTNLGRNGKIEETGVGVEDTLRLQRSVLSQPASTFT